MFTLLGQEKLEEWIESAPHTPEEDWLVGPGPKVPNTDECTGPEDVRQFGAGTYLFDVLTTILRLSTL